jgi:hypothetical protein
LKQRKEKKEPIRNMKACDECRKSRIKCECVDGVRTEPPPRKVARLVGEANPNCKISDEIKELIIARYKAGLKYGELKQISKEYGMSYNWIQKLVQGRK